MGAFDRLREKIGGKHDTSSDDFADEYVDIAADSTPRNSKAKITIRPFVIEQFEHIKPALDALREGYTVALINIRPLKDKDLVELKRAVNKLKKTCDAIEGDIAGFGEDWIVVTPSFGEIFRGSGEASSGSAPSNDEL